jgi:hypothetical protein
MRPTAEERLRSLWLKALAAADPSEKEPLLFEFRDALHEDLDELRADAKNLTQADTTSLEIQSCPLAGVVG